MQHNNVHIEIYFKRLADALSVFHLRGAKEKDGSAVWSHNTATAQTNIHKLNCAISIYNPN